MNTISAPRFSSATSGSVASATNRSAPVAGAQELAAIVEHILQLKASVGDALNEREFSQLIGASTAPFHSLFRPICYSEGCVMFSVPPQDAAEWYGESSWLAPAKEAVAQRIANDFRLSICEPPDNLSEVVIKPEAHHHLEFIANHEVIAAAHPAFLKVRITATNTHHMPWKPHETVLRPVELGRELAELYIN